jgi:hypothetical protein
VCNELERLLIQRGVDFTVKLERPANTEPPRLLRVRRERQRDCRAAKPLSESRATDQRALSCSASVSSAHFR